MQLKNEVSLQKEDKTIDKDCNNINFTINNNSFFKKNSNISDVYFKLFSKIEEPSFNGNLWILEARRHQLNELFKTLQIDTTPEDWQATIESHATIMNRKPIHEKLIIGCGNLPEYSKEVGDVYFIDNYGQEKFEYRAMHHHSNADTIDPDPARNPTFVAVFGKTRIHELFKEHKYKEIFIEGIRILPWDLQSVDLEAYPYALDSLIALLDENGIVFDNGKETYTKSFLEVQRMNYKNSGLEMRSDNFENEQLSLSPDSSTEPKSIDPISTWEPSLALKSKAEDILDEEELCKSIDAFLSKYNLTREDLDLTEEQIESILNVHLWSNFEFYILRPSLTIASQKSNVKLN